jgi:K+-transporting ATPase ATPase C chain
MLLLLTLLTGVAYPLAITGIAQVAFRDQANGSLVTREGEDAGSSLIGQSFVDPETGSTLPGYFRGRPSAVGYDSTLSAGANDGPTSQRLVDRVAQEVAIVRQENGLDASVAIPVDLVTASGSGLDPHISPAAAEIQVARVARERGLTEDQVRDLVADHTQGRLFGILGEPRVNVLALNMALDDAGPLAGA